MAVSRGVAAATRAALAAPVIHPAVLVWLDWPGAPVRAHTGVGTLVWDGHDWAGVGAFGGVQLPAEEGMAADAAQLSLVGLPDELDAYLAAPARCEARIWFGAVTARAGNVLAGEPFLAFAGTVDALRETEEMSGLELLRGVRLAVAPGPGQRSAGALYHTDETQAAEHPGDTAGRGVILAEAQATKLRWPA